MTAPKQMLKRLPWPDGTPITQEYGVLSITGSIHCGLDGGLAEGTPLVPGADGVLVDFVNSWIVFQGRRVQAFGLGQCVRYDDAPADGPRYGLLAHCSELLVPVGSRVTADQVIALSGNTGASTGGHCHYAICDTPAFPIDLSRYVDPRTILLTEDPEMTLAEDILIALLATPEQVATLPGARAAVLASARARLAKVVATADNADPDSAYPDGALAFRVWALETQMEHTLKDGN